MRRTVLAALTGSALGIAAGASAFAADIPARAVLKAPPVPAFSWTGFYLGVYYGVGVSQSRGSDPRPVQLGSMDHIGRGLAGGVQVGYNWQFAPSWVFGVEGDIGYLGINRGQADYFDARATLGIKTSWLATLRGRIAYSTGPSLLYITGGAAWLNVEDSLFDPVTGQSATSSKTRSGWTVGSGIETVLWGNWTNRTEYLYVDVGGGDTLVNTAGFVFSVNQHRFHVFKSALNYKFGAPAAPMPAFNWTGFYVGLNGGLALAQLRGPEPTGTLFGEANNNGWGFIGGIQAGYNWLWTPTIVVGVEGDINYVGIKRSYREFNDVAIQGLKTSWLGTLRARAGYNTGPALLYFTGGAAFLHFEDSWNNALTGASATSAKTKSGWAVGSGIETVLAGNWTTKAEYLFVSVGSGDNLIVPGTGLNLRVTEHKLHTFRWGLNYKFSGAPLVAKF